MWTP